MGPSLCPISLLFSGHDTSKGLYVYGGEETQGEPRGEEGAELYRVKTADLKMCAPKLLKLSFQHLFFCFVVLFFSAI